MNDTEKTKEELAAEVTRLHTRVAELEAAESERHKTKKALQDQIHFLQTLIDTIPSPIFYKDTRGRYLGCNKAFETRLGMEKEDIIGKTAYDIFPRTFADRYHEMDLESFRHPGEQVYETSVLYGDGKKYDVIIYKGTFRDLEGRLAGLVGITIDITERKQAEEALRRAHDELEARIRERTAALECANAGLHTEIAERKRVEEALRDSSEKLKLFAYSVAHDLKSPLIGIHGLTKLLHKFYENCFDERGRNYCNQILRASEHVMDLVEKLNAYAATKELPLTIMKVNVKEILQMIHNEFSAQLDARRIHWSESDMVDEVRADRLSLLRMFRNLVDNALKYGGEQLSEIHLGYEATESHHVFWVHDNGAGIKEKDSERIFELFQRNAGDKVIEGTGLGLAIVKEIAESHQGRVWVKTEVDQGSTFYVAISKFL